MSQPTWFMAPSERCSGSLRWMVICPGRAERRRLSTATNTIAASYPTASTVVAWPGNRSKAGTGKASKISSFGVGRSIAMGSSGFFQSRGTSTRSKTRATHWSAVIPSISASGFSTMR